MKAVFLRHIAHESGGRFAQAVLAAGGSVVTVDSAASDARVQAEAADLVVVLGGPMGVYEAAAYPFLRTELDVIRARLERRAPIVGICLGAQLLAAAAGAQVYKGAAGFEVGFGELSRSEKAEAHPFGAALPPRFTVLHWHGDTFDLPAGATLLASSARYPHQIFVLGTHALGLQCHLEVTSAELPLFAGGNAADLQGAGRPTVETVIAAGRANERQIDESFQRLWQAFAQANFET